VVPSANEEVKGGRKQTLEIMPLTLNKLGEKENEPKITKEHPFIVHSCKDMPAFPSHSHGLTELPFYILIGIWWH
jgi:hypothetical protein